MRADIGNSLPRDHIGAVSEMTIRNDVNLNAKKTVGDLITSGRILYVECKGDREYPCLPKKVVDLSKFPRELPWEDLAKHYRFRCTQCGKSEFKLSLEIEREWKRRLRR